MSDSLSLSPSKISEAVERLRRLTQVDVQGGWRLAETGSPLTGLPLALNGKGHLAWPGGRQVLWLAQRLVVPANLQGYSLDGLCLRLALTWWAEAAEIFVNGQLVQRGDLFDCTARVLLSPGVRAGEDFLVVLRLVSPGHDGGALMRSRCFYEGVGSPFSDPGFVADELEVLQLSLLKSSQFPSTEILPPPTDFVKGEKPHFEKNLNLDLIDWLALPDREKFERSLVNFREHLLEVTGLKGQSEIRLAEGLSPQFNRSEDIGGADRFGAVSEGLVQEELKASLGKISLVGHTHLDLAWLWPVSETWEVAQRTFESVLKLQQEFPDLIFCHSTPALYAWIEEHRPDLFIAIQQQVEAGRWEIVGGMWVEPDLNLVAGESMVRQVLYGQRYTQEKFGQLMSVAWLPDTFGFCWQLPQILKGGGVDYFVTQKLRWNDTNQFPFGVFWWEGRDGTQIFSLMSAPIGEGIEPVKMAKYACEWESQTGLKNALWLPGVGDHGGGPTRDMLEVAKRWQLSPFSPRLEFVKVVDYLSGLAETARKNSEDILIYRSPSLSGETGKTAKDILGSLSGETDTQNSEDRLILASPSLSGETEKNSSHLPIWKDELYLEFHRGCYTTHADQKQWNRRCEGLLYQAELFASLATVLTGAAYPKTELETAWKQVLFNQFHDILPGSAIPEVYVDANQTWQQAQQQTEKILTRAIASLTAQISLSPPPHPDAQPILVFNPLNWSRSEVVTVPLPAASAGAWQLWDSLGRKVRSQVSHPVPTTLLFQAKDLPAVGYRLFWLSPQTPETLEIPSLTQKIAIKPQVTPEIVAPDRSVCQKNSYSPKDWILENELLRVIVEEKSGNLASLYDKLNNRETLNQAGGNQLQAFQDSGQYWDAWNIDPNYAQYPLPSPILKEIQWVEFGEVRQRLRVVRQWQNSEFCQDYILDIDAPFLKIETTVNWQERHILMKAAFGFNLEANFATYEIPCGAIERTTQPKNDREKAKWEVPALQWADISDASYGVSLLNDSKYGYDAAPNQLRLTLLRGSTWPDSEADQGIHQFTYAIYPHPGNWQAAGTVQRGYELNLPLQVRVLPAVVNSTGGEAIQPASLPSEGKFLDLSAENLILMAFKQSEDNPQQWILRCYECWGREAELQLKSDWEWEILDAVDLLERRLDKSEELRDNIQQGLKIAPWKIASFAVILKS